MPGRRHLFKSAGEDHVYAGDGVALQRSSIRVKPTEAPQRAVIRGLGHVTDPGALGSVLRGHERAQRPFADIVELRLSRTERDRCPEGCLCFLLTLETVDID